MQGAQFNQDQYKKFETVQNLYNYSTHVIPRVATVKSMYERIEHYEHWIGYQAVAKFAGVKLGEIDFKNPEHQKYLNYANTLINDDVEKIKSYPLEERVTLFLMKNEMETQKTNPLILEQIQEDKSDRYYKKFGPTVLLNIAKKMKIPYASAIADVVTAASLISETNNYLSKSNNPAQEYDNPKYKELHRGLSLKNLRDFFSAQEVTDCALAPESLIKIHDALTKDANKELVQEIRKRQIPTANIEDSLVRDLTFGLEMQKSEIEFLTNFLGSIRSSVPSEHKEKPDAEPTATAIAGEAQMQSFSPSIPVPPAQIPAVQTSVQSSAPKEPSKDTSPQTSADSSSGIATQAPVNGASPESNLTENQGNKKPEDKDKFFKEVANYLNAGFQIIEGIYAANENKSAFNEQKNEIYRQAEKFKKEYSLDLLDLCQKLKFPQDPNIVKMQLLISSVRNICKDVVSVKLHLKQQKHYIKKINHLIEEHKSLAEECTKRGKKKADSAKHHAKKAKEIKYDATLQNAATITMGVAAFTPPPINLILNGIGRVFGLFSHKKHRNVQKKLAAKQARVSGLIDKAKYLQNLAASNAQSMRQLEEEKEGLFHIRIQELPTNKAIKEVKKNREEQEKKYEKIKDRIDSIQHKIGESHREKKLALEKARTDLEGSKVKIKQSIEQHKELEKILKEKKFNEHVASLNYPEAIKVLEDHKKKMKHDSKAVKHIALIQSALRLESMSVKLNDIKHETNLEKSIKKINAYRTELLEEYDADVKKEATYRESIRQYEQDAKNAKKEQDKNHHSKKVKRTRDKQYALADKIRYTQDLMNEGEALKRGKFWDHVSSLNYPEALKTLESFRNEDEYKNNVELYKEVPKIQSGLEIEYISLKMRTAIEEKDEGLSLQIVDESLSNLCHREKQITEKKKKLLGDLQQYETQAQNTSDVGEKEKFSREARKVRNDLEIASDIEKNVQELIREGEIIKKGKEYERDVKPLKDAKGAEVEKPELTKEEKRKNNVRDHINKELNANYQKYAPIYQSIDDMNHAVLGLFRVLGQYMPPHTRFGKRIAEAQKVVQFGTSLSSFAIGIHDVYLNQYKTRFLNWKIGVGGNVLLALKEMIGKGGVITFAKFVTGMANILTPLAGVAFALAGMQESQEVSMLKDIQGALSALHFATKATEKQLIALSSQEAKHFNQLSFILSNLSRDLEETTDICNTILSKITLQEKRDALEKVNRYFARIRKSLNQIHELNGNFSIYRSLDQATQKDLTEILDYLDLKVLDSVSAQEYNGRALQQSLTTSFTYLADEPEKAVGAIADNLQEILNEGKTAMPNAILLEEIMHALARIAAKATLENQTKRRITPGIERAILQADSLLFFRESFIQPNYILALFKKIKELHSTSQAVAQQVVKDLDREKLDQLSKVKERTITTLSDGLTRFIRSHQTTLPSSAKYMHSLMLTSRKGSVENDYKVDHPGRVLEMGILVSLGIPFTMLDVIVTNTIGISPFDAIRGARGYDPRRHHYYSFCDDQVYSNDIFAGMASDLHYVFKQPHEGTFFNFTKNETLTSSGEYTPIAKFPRWWHQGMHSTFYKPDAKVEFYKPDNKVVSCSPRDLELVPYPFDKAAKFEDRKPVFEPAVESDLIKKYDATIRQMYEDYVNLLQGRQLEKATHFSFSVKRDLIVYSDDHDNLPPLVLPCELIEHLSKLPLVKKLDQMEDKHFGFKRFVYRFQNNKLNLICQFVTANEQIKNCFSIPLISFDNRTVNAYQALHYNKELAKLDQQSFISELLLIAFYGSPNDSIGLPGNTTYAVANDEIVFPVERPFVGLYNILKQFPQCRLDFDSRTYTPEVEARFKSLLSARERRNENLQNLNAFLKDAVLVDPIQDEELDAFSKTTESKQRNTLLRKLGNSESFIKCRNEVEKIYFTLIGYIRLFANIKVSEAQELVTTFFQPLSPIETLSGLDIREIFDIYPSSLDDDGLKEATAHFVEYMRLCPSNNTLAKINDYRTVLQKYLREEAIESSNLFDSEFVHFGDGDEKLLSLADMPRKERPPLVFSFNAARFSSASTSTEAQHLINLNVNKICKTLVLFHNCGFSCLAHFLCHKLESNELQQKFANDPEYRSLLETFQEYYRLSPTPTWDDIAKLFLNYDVPSDRELIFSPVLRMHLGKVLMKDLNKLEAEASAIFSDYLQNGKVKDIALPFYAANEKMMLEMKKQYDKDKNLDAHLEKAKTFWYEEGAKRYIDYLANSTAFISADHLTFLTNALQITLEVYTPQSIAAAQAKLETAKLTHGMQNTPDKEYPWKLRVYNHGVHWEFEEMTLSDKKVTEHNRFYQNEKNLLGQFKWREPEDEMTKEVRQAIGKELNQNRRAVAVSI